VNSLRRRLVIGSSVLVLLLAGCDDKEPTQEADQDASQVIDRTKGNADINAAVLDALKTVPKKGPIFKLGTEKIALKLQAGASASGSVRLLNEGDEEGKIISLAPTTTDAGVAVAGSCQEGAAIAVGGTCDITVSYTDHSGRGLDFGLFIKTTSREAGELTLPVTVEIDPVKEQTTPSAPVFSGPPAPTSAEQRRLAMAALIQSADEARRRGQARLGTASNVPRDYQTEVRFTDPRYDKDKYPWQESSLRVDRHRMITSDKIIKATLSQPIQSTMSTKVTAHSSSPVYAAEGRSILIPNYTVFEGQVEGRVDERIAVRWTRMITPNGVVVPLQADSADAMGQAGIPGVIDYLLKDRILIPLMASAIDAVSVGAIGGGGTTTQSVGTGGVSTTTQESAKSRAADQFITDSSRTLQSGLKDMQNVQPVDTVGEATEIDIVLNEDLYFKSEREVVRVSDLAQYEVPTTASTRPLVPVFPEGLVATPSDGAGLPSQIMIGGQRYALDAAAPRR